VSEPTEPTEPTGPTGPIDVGDALPDLPVTTIHGKTASLTEVQGDCPAVILPFRGTW